MAIKYEKEHAYHVLRELGCKACDDGTFRLAERPERYDNVVTPDERLVFMGRRSGKLVFLRESGVEILGHNNHFDPDASYNMKEPSSVSTSDSLERKLKAFEVRRSCLARAEERRNAQAQKLATFLEENPDVLAHIEGLDVKVQDGSTYESPSDDARAQARELFAEAING